ncbi:MAG TPA: TRAP transporter small permease subunit, partial [Burkholderiaceae bacterium]
MTRLERLLGRLVEWAAALLVAAEIVVLLSGVIARYALQRPLVWSDELASILFLWLALLGAAVALHRGEHMRMTALLTRARPVVRQGLETLAPASALALMLLLAWPSWEYARGEADITTPALEISNAWRAAALPVGIALMALFAGLRLLRTARAVEIVGVLGLLAALAAAFWLAGPWFHGLGRLNLLVFFVGVAGASVLCGVPIAVAFGVSTFGYLALGTSTPLSVMIGRIDEGMSHLVLLSVPLFVFLGLLIETTGMARAMVAFLASLLGHVRGGLSYVLVGAMYLVSGISGS